MNNIHLIVREQFPEFVRADYPVFVEFVKAYYTWFNQQDVGALDQVLDIDNTPERFVDYFRQQLDVYGMLNGNIPFSRTYLKRIKEIYDRRGSQEGLVNLLRLTNNTDVAVHYPSNNILRASAGDWLQEHFITVKRIYGSLPATIREFHIQYQFSVYQIQISRYEIIDNEYVRFYFRPRTNVALTLNQTIYIHNSFGNPVYAGLIQLSPSYIDVIDGGEGWQLGQVITVPGTLKNTIARVSKVNSVGSIERVEVLEYGYVHAQNETVIVSPYSDKPTKSTYTVDTEIISVSPLSRQYTLTLSDYTDGAVEEVDGVMTGLVNVDELVLHQNTFDVNTGTIFDPNTTMEEWLASRATIVFRFDSVSKTRGRWTNEFGQISNQDIRLQDNFYFQQFSYDIKSDVNSSQYLNSAKLVHPAGMKMFTTYEIASDLTILPYAETAFPFLRTDLLDIVQTDDVVAYRGIGKGLFDVTNTPTDNLLISFNKYLTDTVTITSDDTSTSSFVVYNEDVQAYFAEDYVRSETILNIGV